MILLDEFASYRKRIYVFRYNISLNQDNEKKKKKNQAEDPFFRF